VIIRDFLSFFFSFFALFLPFFFALAHSELRLATGKFLSRPEVFIFVAVVVVIDYYIT